MHKENEIPEDIRASIELLVKIIAIHKPDANIQTAIKQQIDNLRNKIIYFEDTL
tara:strand:- start:1499 stop:1660 length:162 start_codon:yes stop_codon:yes gene_type:complete